MEETTIICSDIHLGLDICQAKLFDEFLIGIEERCNRLIINGDLFDSIDFNRLKKSHWKILSDLRRLSKKLDLVWVAGNHDSGIEVLSHLIGAKVVDQFHFVSDKKSILIIHGHQFDDFISEHYLLTWFADYIYRCLQYWDNTHTLARWAKYSSKHYLRCLNSIREKALKLAQKEKANIIICGHTHNAEAFIKNEILYLNSGSFCENPATYIIVSEGIAQIIPYGPCG